MQCYYRAVQQNKFELKVVLCQRKSFKLSYETSDCQICTIGFITRRLGVFTLLNYLKRFAHLSKVSNVMQGEQGEQRNIKAYEIFVIDNEIFVIDHIKGLPGPVFDQNITESVSNN